MLEGLDRIDWYKLSHAYGSAEDVPGLIRQLASDQAAVRDKAIDKLFGNIYHQGTVYEATAYAVPFLIELLQEASVQDKHWILVLLAHIAHGSSYLDVHQHLPLYKELMIDPMDPAEFQEELQEQLGWVEKAYLAVQDGFAVYLSLLEDPEPKVRMVAAYTLASFRPHAATSASRLLARIPREDDPRAKASMLLSLSLMAEPDAAVLRASEESLRTAEHDLVRIAAAMALARLTREQAPPMVIQVLIESLGADEALAELYAELPWSHSGIIGDVSTFLCYLNPNQVRFAIPILLRTLSTIKRPEEGGRRDRFSLLDATYVAQVLLHVAFDGQPVRENITAHDLTEEQKIVLNAIAESKAAWTFLVDMGAVMQHFGLPDDPDRLRRFLGLEGTLFPEPGTVS